MDHVPNADDVPPGARPGPGPVAPGSLGPHPERHPDDLPPADPPRRRLPAGVLWAAALGIIVLMVASWVALSSEPAPDPNLVRLTDPSATVPAPGLGGLDVVGQPASATTYTTFDGATTSVAAHAGTPVVLNFWASTCPPCITEMPAFERAHRAVGDQVAFIGLATTDPESQARALADQTGVTYELGFDPTGEIIRQFGAVSLPTTVFVDADGRILESTTSELDDAEIRERIRTHFGVEVPEGP